MIKFDQYFDFVDNVVFWHGWTSDSLYQLEIELCDCQRVFQTAKYHSFVFILFAYVPLYPFCKSLCARCVLSRTFLISAGLVFFTYAFAPGHMLLFNILTLCCVTCTFAVFSTFFTFRVLLLFLSCAFLHLKSSPISFRHNVMLRESGDAPRCCRIFL